VLLTVLPYPLFLYTQQGYLKVINASQSTIWKFESLKRKLYNCNTSIHFNRQCLKKNLTPSYAQIKVPNTSPARARAHARTHTHTAQGDQYKDKRWNKIPILQKTKTEYTNVPNAPDSSKHLGQPMATHLPYFPAHKMHFFPRKMWPKFDLHIMRRG